MRIHLIPNSHIDPVWLWDKYEGIDEVINTFRSVCDRLDQFHVHRPFSFDSRLAERLKRFHKTLFRGAQHAGPDHPDPRLSVGDAGVQPG